MTSWYKVLNQVGTDVGTSMVYLVQAIENQ